MSLLNMVSIVNYTAGNAPNTVAEMDEEEYAILQENGVVWGPYVSQLEAVRDWLSCANPNTCPAMVVRIQVKVEQVGCLKQDRD